MRRTRRDRSSKSQSARVVSYRNLRNPFPAMNAFSDDEIMNMHHTALRVLEELGVRVLNPNAIKLFKAGGARIEGDMVYLGKDMITAALSTAPKSFQLRGANRDRDLTLELGSLTFQPGAGCPHATDLERGRRPGSLEDFRDLIKITQHYDVLHMAAPLVEAQDIPIHLRHYHMTETMLTLSDKPVFIYSRGTEQVEDGFEMIRDFYGLSDAEFKSHSHCYTIINTNSPRVLDLPMAQGIMDFAIAGQVCVITPFTLMGAMAPITPAGAITLSHAEALAAITLSQLTNPGAPVCYGTFTSNVDMKSGAPAFGTPEHFRASLAAGQLARLVGLPWRCAGGSAGNINDVQAANESQFGLWGCLLAGATLNIHSAGWLEGGLTISYEKIITDVEVLQMVAEMCRQGEATEDAIGFDAIAETDPQGHFFQSAQTMARYQTEFYEPLVGDWSNFGTWTENGSKTASERAMGIWKEIVSNETPVPIDSDRVGALHDFIAKRTQEGGAPPVS